MSFFFITFTFLNIFFLKFNGKVVQLKIKCSNQFQYDTCFYDGEILILVEATLILSLPALLSYQLNQDFSMLS